MTPPTQSMIIIDDDISKPILVGDAMQRLGRLEVQVNQILPVMGRVAEAVEKLDRSMVDLTTDVKETRREMNNFRLESAGYGNRISDIEDDQKRSDTMKIQDLMFAKTKAEGILEDQVKEEKKHQVARRNDLIKLGLTALGTFLGTLILTWLKLK